jgi:hypothetical protein
MSLTFATFRQFAGLSRVAYAENIAACDALKLLAERGVDDPHGQLLSALRDGSVTAGGYVRQYSPPKQAGKAPWREIPWVWWRHGNSKIDDGVAYFDNAATEPPTPFRVEGIEISKASIDALWPPLRSIVMGGHSRMSSRRAGTRPPAAISPEGAARDL